MQGFEAGFGRWIISYRWLVIALALGLLGLVVEWGSVGSLCQEQTKLRAWLQKPEFITDRTNNEPN